MKTYFLFLVMIILIGCNGSPISIQNSAASNFSDLYHITSPKISLFDNHETLPIETNVSSDVRNYNSILHLTESTNVISIERESLQKILPKEEFKDLLHNYCEPGLDNLICQKEYFTYGRIVTENFVLLELNIREYGNWNRHYIFEWRTHKLNGELISKVTFAKWSNRDSEFFGGKLIKYLEVEIVDTEHKSLRNYWIDNVGEIHLKEKAEGF
ncbi:MAG: hypothetical protein R3E32_20360 [Chitinophagales bacterium]